MIKLSPRVDDHVKNFLDESELINDLISGFGSPLNIVFPALIGKNLAAFRDVYARHGIKGKIFYAHKVNRSGALAREAAASGACIDVASKAELASALAAGFAGGRIEATGPKNDDFILLGIQHGIIFNVDNAEELQSIVSLKSKYCAGLPRTRVLLRVSNFPNIARKSRFGTSYSMFCDIISMAADAAGAVDVIGISFHLDSVEQKEKVAAISGSLGLFEPLRAAGFSPRVLDIGGGFKVNYVESKAEWQDVVSKIKESIISGDGSMTWNGYRFGMGASGGALRGSPNIYSYYNSPAGAEYLDAILSSELSDYEDRTVADFLCDNMIGLYIEPGRAFLDQAGVSFACVNSVKRILAGGGHLVVIDAKANDLIEQDGFIDPIVIGANGPRDDEGCYIAGSLCAESDMISRRRFFLDRVPKKGDVMAFANTAGYFMDFHSTAAAMKYPAPKIAAYKNGGRWRWSRDENYFPQGSKQ